MTDRLVKVLHVAPPIRSVVFQPKNLCCRVAGQRIAIKTFLNTSIASFSAEAQRETVLPWLAVSAYLVGENHPFNKHRFVRGLVVGRYRRLHSSGVGCCPGRLTVRAG